MFAAIMLAGGVHATDTHVLELDDGGRLQGEFLGLEGERIHFRSAILGEIFVPAARAKVRPLPVADAQHAAQQPTWARATATPVAPGPAAAVASPAPGTAPTGPAAAGTPQPAPVAAPMPARSPWRRFVEFGYSLQSSNVSKSDAYVRGELTRVSEHYSYKLYGKYLYGEQQSVRNVDKLEAGFKAQQEIAGRWRFRNESLYQHDQLRLLSRELTEIGGVSYAIVTGRKFQLSAGPGAGARYREPEIGRTGWTFTTDFCDELGWQISSRIRLAQEGNVLTDPNHPANYRLRSATTASGKLDEHLSVNVRYEYEFDHARPVIVDRSDQRVFTTLGYTF